MALTIDELKKRYYRIVVEKGCVIYSEWGKNGTSSKQIVAKANEYAFDKRLKTDGVFRFRVLAFSYALGLRLGNRYKTLLRKLIHILAFMRERDALQVLKHVLGSNVDADLRDLVDVEIERISVELSQNGDRRSNGGGKRVDFLEFSLEEELEEFLEECALDETQKESKNDLPSDDGDETEKKAEQPSDKTDKTDHEKKPVDNKKEDAKGTEDEKEISQDPKKEESKKEQTEQKQTEKTEGKRTDSLTDKSAANTSILAEMMITVQGREKEPPSPFPIFKESDAEHSAATEQDGSNANKEQNETKPNYGKDEPIDGNERGEPERRNLPPPSPRQEDSTPIKSVEKPMEKPSGKPIEKPIEKAIEPLENQGSDEGLDRELREMEEIPFYEKMKISDENRERIKLNVTMSKPQIDAITEQLKQAAIAEMEKEEIEWRQQISVMEGANHLDGQENGAFNRPNNGNPVMTL